MRALSTLLLILAAMGCQSQKLTLPARRIHPEDVDQQSVQLVRLSTNTLAVSWTYTEDGAKKMLTFNREHAGREILIQVGDFEHLIRIAPLDAQPAGWTERSYHKRRRDKFFTVREEDAKKIVEGLRTK
ncbi:MAG: hypothetical protein JNK85_01745 [Verrucomicrobiales bacterium]|nr:hypothetical protein [Verrucomicrobiales bacterium]